jgi:predicted enzyme related to lactoylglutathione lyase
MKLSGILIGSEDPARLTEYYTRVFGKPGWDSDGFVGWMFDGGWVVVGHHDQVKGKSAHPGRIIWNLETTDVQGDFEKLKAAGATVVKEPYHPGQMEEGQIATFEDPDGNYFQLMSPMEAG